MQSILIIDDDQTIGNLEQEVLERAGYDAIILLAAMGFGMVLFRHKDLK